MLIIIFFYLCWLIFHFIRNKFLNSVFILFFCQLCCIYLTQKINSLKILICFYLINFLPYFLFENILISVIYLNNLFGWCTMYKELYYLFSCAIKMLFRSWLFIDVYFIFQKTLFPPIFPPDYDIVKLYVRMYHRCLSAHVSKLCFCILLYIHLSYIS